MRSLNARLKKLEQAVDRRSLKRSRYVAERYEWKQYRRAVADLWDVLEQHYPIGTGIAGRSVDPEKLRAAAVRVQSGEPSPADRAALAAMPKETLRIFGRTGGEFVCAVADVLERPHSAEDLEEAARYAESMGSW